MKIFFIYNKDMDEIKLTVNDTQLYNEIMEELEEFTDSLSSDLEVDIHIDEMNKDIVLKSKLTDNVVKGHYKALNGIEICSYLYDIAIMDNVWIYLEEFNTLPPITLSPDEIPPFDFDE